jgi:glycosyltransferase involved in cell wall biosynthesis
MQNLNSLTTSSPSLTIVVAAYNEDQNIRRMIEDLLPVALKSLKDFEVLIINDGSTDNTEAIVGELVTLYPNYIKGIKFDTNSGLATVFRVAIKKSTKNYICLLPGDGAFEASSLDKVFEKVGTTDMILTNRSNQNVSRSVLRRALAKSFIEINKLIFSLDVKDINTLGVYPIKTLKEIQIVSKNWAFNLEILVKLIRKNLSYSIVDLKLEPENHIVGKSLNLKFITDIIYVSQHLLLKKE